MTEIQKVADFEKTITETKAKLAKLEADKAKYFLQVGRNGGVESNAVFTDVARAWQGSTPDKGDEAKAATTSPPSLQQKARLRWK